MKVLTKENVTRWMRKAIVTATFVWLLSPHVFAQYNCAEMYSAPQPTGVAYPLWNRHLFNKGILPQAVYYHTTEDVLQFTIEDGASMNLRDDQIAVSIESTPHSSVQTDVSGWHCYKGKVATVSSVWGSRSPTVILDRWGFSGVTTIVLSKAKWFGMVDMYHLDQRYFWPMFAGKIVRVSWADDSAFAPYQLGNCPIASAAQQPFTLAPCIPMIPFRGGEFFDYDSNADRVVYRPQTAEWLIPRTSSSWDPRTKQFGTAGDIPVPADYDADGRKDIAVWRPSTGEWRILRSNSGIMIMVQWGTSGDIPVPGDYDGDGRVDFAVWRPSTGVWWIINSSNNTVQSVQWGMMGDVPVAADYNGDGKTELALWRPSTGVWWILNGFGRALTPLYSTRQFGTAGDVPVPGDYDGDGRVDVALWRPSTGVWWIINSSNNMTSTRQWGLPTDVPVPQDYDGDKKMDLAVWRPFDASTLNTGVWLIISSRDGSTSSTPFGLPSDKPIPVK